MKSKLKHISTILVLFALTACASTPVELDRSVFASKKIEQVQLQHLPQSVSIELSSSGTVGGAAGAGLLGALVGGAIDAGVNSSRKSKFAPILESLGDFDSNALLQSALNENMNGDAFATEVEIAKGFDRKNRRPILTPLITPSIIMSANYGVVDVLLSVATYQNTEEKKPYLSFHSSQQLVEDDGIKVEKEANRQFWIDNPEILASKITAGINEVAQMFANDFNGVEAQESSEEVTAEAEAESAQPQSELETTEATVEEPESHEQFEQAPDQAE